MIDGAISRRASAVVLILLAASPCPLLAEESCRDGDCSFVSFRHYCRGDGVCQSCDPREGGCTDEWLGEGGDGSSCRDVCPEAWQCDAHGDCNVRGDRFPATSWCRANHRCADSCNWGCVVRSGPFGSIDEKTCPCCDWVVDLNQLSGSTAAVARPCAWRNVSRIEGFYKYVQVKPYAAVNITDLVKLGKPCGTTDGDADGVFLVDCSNELSECDDYVVFALVATSMNGQQFFYDGTEHANAALLDCPPSQMERAKNTMYVIAFLAFLCCVCMTGTGGYSYVRYVN